MARRPRSAPRAGIVARARGRRRGAREHAIPEETRGSRFGDSRRTGFDRPHAAVDDAVMTIRWTSLAVSVALLGTTACKHKDDAAAGKNGAAASTGAGASGLAWQPDSVKSSSPACKKALACCEAMVKAEKPAATAPDYNEKCSGAAMAATDADRDRVPEGLRRRADCRHEARPRRLQVIVAPRLALAVGDVRDCGGIHCYVSARHRKPLVDVSRCRWCARERISRARRRRERGQERPSALRRDVDAERSRFTRLGARRTTRPRPARTGSRRGYSRRRMRGRP